MTKEEEFADREMAKADIAFDVDYAEFTKDYREGRLRWPVLTKEVAGRFFFAGAAFGTRSALLSVNHAIDVALRAMKDEHEEK